MTFDAVADELYSLPPGEFVAARNARAKELAAAGNKAVGAEIRKLARPSPSAWIVNCLVRQNKSDVERLLSLRSSFQGAQRKGARDLLRELSVERQSIIEGLVTQGRDVAARAGQTMAPGVQGELERTLEAAVADEDAARAVRQGRLVRGLSHVGFGGLDLPAESGRAPTRTTGTARSPASRSTPSPGQEEREQKKRRAVLEQAEARLKEARRRLRSAEANKGRAAEMLARTERELGRAADALTRATDAYEQAGGQL